MPRIESYMTRRQAPNPLQVSEPSSKTLNATSTTSSQYLPKFKEKSSSISGNNDQNDKRSVDGTKNQEINNHTNDQNDSDDDVVIIEEFSTIKKPQQAKKVLPRSNLVKEESAPATNELQKPMAIRSVAYLREVEKEANPDYTGNQLTTPVIDRQRRYRDKSTSHLPPTPATPKYEKSILTPPKTARYGSGSFLSAGKPTRSTPTIGSTLHAISKNGVSKERAIKRSDLISSNYTTPKTTRKITNSTPNSTFNRDKLTNGRRVPQLVYRPLELDNESSSESSDSFLIHCRQSSITSSAYKRKGSQNSYQINKKLAIEAPPAQLQSAN